MISIDRMDYANQESERLIYRRATFDDIPAWSEFFVDNDRLHFFDFDLTKTKEELAEQWIVKQFERYTTNGYGHLAVELKSTGALIAMGGILPREIKGRPEFEIGYSVNPRYWGNGYATETAMTMKDFAINQIDSPRFISIIDLENHQSANVAVKNGMKVLFQTDFMGAEVNIYGIDNSAKSTI
ncbi:GNAT family N-acetyltransferase [Cryomorphaceae bacterium 1068]|nr:GNAT family N-acetyltransferase [Cryomorphaceae bacterium 1068]